MRKRNHIIKSVRRAGKSPLKIIIYGLAVLVGSYLIVSFVLGEMGVVKYYRMKIQYDRLTEEISRLKRSNTILETEVSSLKSDPAYIEKIARDKLGLARPGEIVYYYKQPCDPNPGSGTVNSN